MQELQIFAVLGGLSLIAGGALIAFVTLRRQLGAEPVLGGLRHPQQTRGTNAAARPARAIAGEPPARVLSAPPARVRAAPLTRVTFLGGERYMGPGEEADDRTSWGPGVMCRIRERLLARGFVTGSVVVDDHGCALVVRSGVDRLMLRCGFRDEAWIVVACDAGSGRDPSEDSALLVRVRRHLDELLRGLDGLSGIIWLTADEKYSEDAPTRITPPPAPAVGAEAPASAARAAHGNGAVAVGPMSSASASPRRSPSPAVVSVARSEALLTPPPAPRAAPVKFRRDPRLPPPLPRTATPERAGGVAPRPVTPLRARRVSSNEAVTAPMRPGQ